MHILLELRKDTEVSTVEIELETFCLAIVWQSQYEGVDLTNISISWFVSVDRVQKWSCFWDRDQTDQ